MKHTAIIYGNSDTPIIRTALSHLSSLILEQTMAYPSCFRYPHIPDKDKFHLIFIGTKQDNPYIESNSDCHLSKAEEYSITVKDGITVIEGFDDAGVLYGCVDFYNRYIIEFENTDTHPALFRNIFEEESLPDFHYSSAPSVKNRGIWTWGHVIYNFEKFIDNMMWLKFNTLTIWNDFVPVNAKEMIDYAHSRNIKIIWGYSWLWDTDCSQVTMEKLEQGANQALDKFEREYAPLGVDGIYFQSFTELHTEKIGDMLIAQSVADFVNKTASKFFEKFGELELQFGIHATSVSEKLEYIKMVDTRIRLCWEDCGSFPFAYEASNTKAFSETMDFVSKITSLRDNEKFGAVTKGFVCLDWAEFEHLPGSFYIGKCSKLTASKLSARKRKFWRYSQAYWLANAEVAYDTVKEMYNQTCGDMYICALVEDGMFEESIMYPIALYSEMLWDTNSDLAKLQSNVALRSYVEFA